LFFSNFCPGQERKNPKEGERKIPFPSGGERRGKEGGKASRKEKRGRWSDLSLTKRKKREVRVGGRRTELRPLYLFLFILPIKEDRGGKKGGREKLGRGEGKRGKRACYPQSRPFLKKEKRKRE